LILELAFEHDESAGERAVTAGSPRSSIILCAHPSSLCHTILLWNSLVTAVKFFYWLFLSLTYTYI